MAEPEAVEPPDPGAAVPTDVAVPDLEVDAGPAGVVVGEPAVDPLGDPFGDKAVPSHSPPPVPAAAEHAQPLLASLRQWHNRLPWARRLAESEVTGIGLVKLALSDDAAARPLYRAQPLVPGVSAARLSRLVRRHGYDERPGPADWPVRELGPDPVEPGQAVRWRYLMTAAFPAQRGDALLRVLAGRVSGAKAMPFVGRRALSPRRLALSAAVAGLLLALLGGGVWAWRGHTSAALPAAQPAASAPASASAAASSATGASDSASISASAEASAVVQAAAEPASAEATTDMAGSAVAAAPGGSLASAPAPAPAPLAPPEPRVQPPGTPPRPASAPAGPLENLSVTAPSPAASVPAGPPRYALVSLPQADPEAPAARELKRQVSQSLSLRAQDRQLEWMPSPGGQVLTLWPYENKAEAERVARKLQRQGLDLQVVAF
jgi:hypothetical protein